MDQNKFEKIETIIKRPPEQKTENQYFFSKQDISGKMAKNFIQAWFKKNPELYKFLVNFFGPVYLCSGLKEKDLFRLVDPQRNIIIDLGSGPNKASDVIKIDNFPFLGVDLVADVENLPLKDCSVDAVICQSILEHVRNPQKVIFEIERVLKPNGYALIVAPFLEGYHEAPKDYQRWTKRGLENMLSNFKIINYRPTGGPFSVLVWVLHEFFADFLSFGLESVYQFLKLIFLVILCWLKYLDFFFTRLKRANYLAASHSFIVKKS